MTQLKIIRRDESHRLAGSFAIEVDGYDSWYTCHPHQFARKAANLLAAQGVAAGVDLAIAVGQLQEVMAKDALKRVIREIRAGQRGAGGGVVSQDVSGNPLVNAVANIAQGMTAAEYEKWREDNWEDENASVNRFMTRGKLGKMTDKAKKTRLLKPHAMTDQDRQRHIIEHKIKKLENHLAAIEKQPSSPAREQRKLALTAELESLKKATVLAASHGFQFFFGELLNADTDMVTQDIRIVPLMTNTTADTERDAVDQYSDFTTPDLFDGANAPTSGSALNGQAVNIDDANDRAEYDADDVSRSALGAGTRPIQGELLIDFLTTLAGSLPQFWIEYASSKTPDGGTFTVVFNAEGILQVTG